MFNHKLLNANLLELKKTIVAIGGPLTNLVVIVFLLFHDFKYIQNDISIYANFLIIVFNLLPIYPLDGGRILKGLIHIFYGGKMAKILTNKIENIVTIIITMIGSIAIFYFKNIAIFFIIVFLWCLVIRENRKYKIIMNAYNII